MQQMEEPKGRAYSEAYQGNRVDLGYGDRQSSEEYYIGENEQPQYQTNEWGQQKLQPTSRSRQVQRVMAIVLVIITAITMAISIALFTLSTINLPTGVDVMLSSSFTFSLLMMLFSIAAFVVSVIQVSLSNKKRFRRLW